MEKNRWTDKKIMQNMLHRDIENASDLNDGFEKQKKHLRK